MGHAPIEDAARIRSAHRTRSAIVVSCAVVTTCATLASGPYGQYTKAASVPAMRPSIGTRSSMAWACLPRIGDESGVPIYRTEALAQGRFATPDPMAAAASSLQRRVRAPHARLPAHPVRQHFFPERSAVRFMPTLPGWRLSALRMPQLLRRDVRPARSCNNGHAPHYIRIKVVFQT